MFLKGNLCVIKSCVPPQATGQKIIRQSEGLVDVKELHELLLNTSNYVVIANETVDSDSTIYQYLTLQERLMPSKVNNEECDTFAFAMYGRTLNGVANRKIIMAFTDTLVDEPSIMCTYYTS